MKNDRPTHRVVNFEKMAQVHVRLSLDWPASCGRFFRGREEAIWAGPQVQVHGVHDVPGYICSSSKLERIFFNLRLFQVFQTLENHCLKHSTMFVAKSQWS